LLYWLPVLIWAVLIFWLSSLSVTPEPAAVRAFPGWSQEAHFTLYLVLGALLLRAVSAQSSGMLFSMPIAIGALYAASDEVHQYFVPGRQADILDFMVDLAGLTVGILMAFYCLKLRPERNKSYKNG
jgi:VanZ family protein